MADRTVKVNIEAGNLKEVISQVKHLNKELHKLEGSRSASTGSRAADAALASSGGGGGRSGLTRGTAANFSRGDSRDFARQAQGLGGLVHVYATFAANVFAATAAFGALSKAMEFERMQKGMEALEKTTGRALSTIAKNMVSATEGAISFTESVRYTNLSTAAGFTAEQIERLTGVAKGASSALGRDLADAMDRLVRGTAKLEPELLDELGLLTRTQKAGEAYAKSIGKTFEQLTQFEKTQAFVNAVITEGEQKYGAIAKAVDQNPFTRLAATLDNQGKKLLSFINVVMVPLANVLSTSPGLMTTAILGIAGLLVNKAIPSISQWADAQVDGTKRAIEAQNRFKDKVLESSRLQAKVAKDVNRQKVRTATAEARRFRQQELTPAFERLRERGMKAFSPRSKAYAAFRDLTPKQAADQAYMNKLIAQGNVALKNNTDIVNGAAQGNRRAAYERSVNIGYIEKETAAFQKATTQMVAYNAQVEQSYAARGAGKAKSLETSPAYLAKQFRGELGVLRKESNATFASTADVNGFAAAFSSLGTSWDTFNSKIKEGRAAGQISALGAGLQRLKFVGSSAFAVLATGASTLMAALGPIIMLGGLLVGAFQLLANTTGGYKKETAALNDSLDAFSNLVDSNTEKIREFDNIVSISNNSLSDINKTASYSSNMLQDLDSALGKTTAAFVASRAAGMGWADSLFDWISDITPGMKSMSEEFGSTMAQAMYQMQRVSDPEVFAQGLVTFAEDLSNVLGRKVRPNLIDVKQAIKDASENPQQIETVGLAFRGLSKYVSNAATAVKSDTAQILAGIEKIASASTSLDKIKIKDAGLKELYSGLNEVINGMEHHLVPGATDIVNKISNLSISEDKLTPGLKKALDEFNSFNEKVKGKIGKSLDEVFGEAKGKKQVDDFNIAVETTNSQLEALNDLLQQGGGEREIERSKALVDSILYSNSKAIQALKLLRTEALTKGDKAAADILDKRIQGAEAAAKVIKETAASAVQTQDFGPELPSVTQLQSLQGVNVAVLARAAATSKITEASKEDAAQVQANAKALRDQIALAEEMAKKKQAISKLADLEGRLLESTLALEKEKAKTLENQLSFLKGLGLESSEYLRTLEEQKTSNDLRLGTLESEISISKLSIQYEKERKEIEASKQHNAAEQLKLLKKIFTTDLERLAYAGFNTQELIKQKATLAEIARLKAKDAKDAAFANAKISAAAEVGLVSKEDQEVAKLRISQLNEVEDINRRINAAKDDPAAVQELEREKQRLLITQDITDATLKRKQLLQNINSLEQASLALLESGATNALGKRLTNEAYSLAMSKAKYDYEQRINEINNLNVSEQSKELLIAEARLNYRKKELEVLEKTTNAQIANAQASGDLLGLWNGIAESAKIYAEKTKLPVGGTLIGPGIINAGDKTIDSALDKLQAGEKVKFTDLRDTFRNEMSDVFKNAAGNELKNAFRGLFGFAQGSPVSGQAAETEFGQLKIANTHLAKLSNLNADGSTNIVNSLSKLTGDQKQATEDQTKSFVDVIGKLGNDISTNLSSLGNYLGSFFSSSGSSGGSSVLSTIVGAVANYFAPGSGAYAQGAISQYRVSQAGVESFNYGNYYAVADTIDSANGNVMTKYGALELEKYSRGGIATSPQLAVFGEGSTPEAYVPLPDGRSIPVNMKGQVGNNNSFGDINISVTVAEGNTTQDSSNRTSENIGAQLGNTIKAVVIQELVKQSRPGGILSR